MPDTHTPRPEPEVIHAESLADLRRQIADLVGLTPEELDSRRLPNGADGTSVRAVRTRLGDPDAPTYKFCAPGGSFTVALSERSAAVVRVTYH